jgi:DNA polymerase-3 subunit chi
MSEVAFYHLTRSTLEQTLPKLLEKTLDAGRRAVVKLGSMARVEALNAALWTFDPTSWLAHGSAKDGAGERQPIWLTDGDDNPGGASYVFLAEGAQAEDVSAYERVFVLFDGTSEEALDLVRTQWKTYKDQGLDLTYWQQTESGGWQKKIT